MIKWVAYVQYGREMFWLLPDCSTDRTLNQVGKIVLEVASIAGVGVVRIG